MNLYIKKIVIWKNEKITESLDFNDGLSVIKGSAEIYDVIKLVIGKHEAAHSFYNIRFMAIVELDKTYHICGEKNKSELMFNVSIYSNDLECTKEYFKKVRQNDEMDSSLFFHRFKRQDYPNKLFRYRDLLKYYPDGDFVTLTNGYGTTRSFRGFITQYVKHFKPIKLRKDKDLFLKISDDGTFCVGYLDNNEKVALSESENSLYHYLSFISIADFWDRAERIRNINYIKKPLIISAILERIDESIDVDEILKKTNLLERQTILCVAKECITTKYDVKNGEFNG